VGFEVKGGGCLELFFVILVLLLISLKCIMCDTNFVLAAAAAAA
jgi:hypothetical protein